MCKWDPMIPPWGKGCCDTTRFLVVVELGPQREEGIHERIHSLFSGITHFFHRKSWLPQSESPLRTRDRPFFTREKPFIDSLAEIPFTFCPWENFDTKIWSWKDPETLSITKWKNSSYGNMFRHLTPTILRAIIWKMGTMGLLLQPCGWQWDTLVIFKEHCNMADQKTHATSKRQGTVWRPL